MALILQQWQQQSGLEVIAFVLAVLYVLLAAKQNIWCWICAFISTSIYVFLFYEVSLPFQSMLNGFYIVMAVYGFTKWQSGATTSSKTLEVSALSAKHHVGIISGCALISVMLIVFAKAWFNSSHVELDVATTVFSVAATVMTANKIIDNWYYWFVTNIASSYLLIQTQLYLTAVLMAIYTVVAVYGWYEWRKTDKSVIL